VAGDLVEVELDDELDEPSRRPARTPRRPWSTRVWTRLAAVLALVLAGGVVADGIGAPALLPGGRGLVADLRVPRHEAWRADGRLLGAAGDVVLLEDVARGTVTGRRVTDGVVVWTERGLDGCSLVGLDDDPLRRAVLHAAGRARLVCRPAAGSGAGLAGADESVAVLDAADGGVLLRDPDVGTTAGWATVGAHLVLLTGGERSRIAVFSLVDGRQLWSVAVDADQVAAGWFAAEDWLVLGVAGSAYRLATGERRDALGLEAASRTLLPGGTVLTAHWGAQGAGVRTEADDAAGTRLWSARAYPFVPPLLVDGGVVPLATPSGALEVRDALTGHTLWSAVLEGPLLAQVGGVLVELSYDVSRLAGDDVEGVAGGTTALVGFDLATGDELWDLRAGASEVVGSPGIVSDGTRFAVPAVTGDGVDVRDLRTGSVVARWPGDEQPGSALAVLPRGLVARITDARVAVLAP
jgi:outer membrane protein assembly factor BamB